MTTSPRETATLTLDALVKEHNVVVSLAAENLQLREELKNLQFYASQLEGLVHEYEEATKDNPDGVKAPVPPEEGFEAFEGQEVSGLRPGDVTPENKDTN